MIDFEKQQRHYAGLARDVGPSPEGVSWDGREIQEACFAQFLRLIPEGTATVNDFGCGYGALFGYLREHGRDPVYYNAYDTCAGMLVNLVECYKGDIDKIRIINLGHLVTIADYTVASGTFNTKFDNSIEDWEKWIRSMIVYMSSFSIYGFAFNLLSEANNEALYCTESSKWCDFAYEKATRQHVGRAGDVELIDDYAEDNFTIIVRYR